jgi:DNA-binding CsgD family transcriptional regulator
MMRLLLQGGQRRHPWIVDRVVSPSAWEAILSPRALATACPAEQSSLPCDPGRFAGSHHGRARSDSGIARIGAERARRELLATGETVRKRKLDTIDDLTAQEMQIARLAAEGRTNPEVGGELFVSPRTVEWHLRKVFTKLGIGSRRELREALPAAALV